MTPKSLLAMSMLIKRLACAPRTEETQKHVAALKAIFNIADYDLSLSNIGRLGIPVDYGSLRLESLYGPTFSAVADRIVGVNTVGGQMRFTFVFQKALMDASSGQQVRDLAMRHLGDAVGWES
jgi:hypothetical protein